MVDKILMLYGITFMGLAFVSVQLGFIKGHLNYLEKLIKEGDENDGRS